MIRKSKLENITKEKKGMSKITIDGKDYDVEEISDNVKAQLTSLQFVDNEIKRLSAQIAVLQTARNAYGRAVKLELENKPNEVDEDVDIEGLGDTLKFD